MFLFPAIYVFCMAISMLFLYEFLFANSTSQFSCRITHVKLFGIKTEYLKRVKQRHRKASFQTKEKLARFSLGVYTHRVSICICTLSVLQMVSFLDFNRIPRTGQIETLESKLLDQRKIGPGFPWVFILSESLSVFKLLITCSSHNYKW